MIRLSYIEFSVDVARIVAKRWGYKTRLTWTLDIRDSEVSNAPVNLVSLGVVPAMVIPDSDSFNKAEVWGVDRRITGVPLVHHDIPFVRLHEIVEQG